MVKLNRETHSVSQHSRNEDTGCLMDVVIYDAEVSELTLKMVAQKGHATMTMSGSHFKLRLDEHRLRALRDYAIILLDQIRDKVSDR